MSTVDDDDEEEDEEDDDEDEAPLPTAAAVVFGLPLDPLSNAASSAYA